MKKSMKSLIAITGGSSLLLSSMGYAMTSHNPCDSAANKSAIHCAYLGQSADNAPGKYLKIKEVIQGQASSTTIFCASGSHHPLMSIPEYLWNTYQPGQNVSWQFTQCVDEDCTSGKVLSDDKFTITKTGKLYSSGPKSAVEITMDPGFGATCKPAGVTHAQHAQDSSLQLRIDDAVAMLEAIPGTMNNTLSILGQMQNLASQASSGTYSSTQLADLDTLFQTYKNEISKVQNVSTLDGVKKIAGGSISIQIGDYSTYSFDVLNIQVPATNVYGLGLQYADVQTQSDAMSALMSLETAAEIIESGLAYTKITK